MPGNTSSFNESVGEPASTMSEQVSDATQEIRNKAAHLGGAAADKIDEKRDAAADVIDKAASALHEKAENLPGGEKVGRFTHTAADKLGASAQYIREHDARRMMAHAETLVKKNPGLSLLVAAVFGFVAGRALSNNG